MDRVPEEGSSEPGVVLTGGNMSDVVRRGDVVHRAAGPWTPTIHRLLDHLHAHGITWVPRPLGLDEDGREVLSYLPGVVPSYPMPPWVWSSLLLVEAGTRLAELHRATAGFNRAGAVWQIPAHQPAEVVCLNDVAPYNMVFDDAHRLCGVIDLDTASPDPRVWDLAYLAYRLVPLTQVGDTGAGALPLTERRERLQQLGQAYARAGDCAEIGAREILSTAIERLVDLAEFTARRAEGGASQVAAHVQIYRDDAGWVERHLPSLGGG
ncbi:MAG: hypothetical protein JWP61_1975 [Friedmanniella sp.]|nr:hypothetical protein [Friedmanniella sp.]